MKEKRFEILGILIVTVSILILFSFGYIPMKIQVFRQMSKLKIRWVYLEFGYPISL